MALLYPLPFPPSLSLPTLHRSQPPPSLPPSLPSLPPLPPSLTGFHQADGVPLLSRCNSSSCTGEHNLGSLSVSRVSQLFLHACLQCLSRLEVHLIVHGKPLKREVDLLSNAPGSEVAMHKFIYTSSPSSFAMGSVGMGEPGKVALSQCRMHLIVCVCYRFC